MLLNNKLLIYQLNCVKKQTRASDEYSIQNGHEEFFDDFYQFFNRYII